MPAATLHVDPRFQPAFRELGIDADAIFTHPHIIPWRTADVRENCLLEAQLADGARIRWHIKRFTAPVALNPARDPAAFEAAGIRLLAERGVPTVPLVAFGHLADGRAFVITEDLAGHQAADKLVESGTPFGALLAPTAHLAAALHSAGLHHRDLYLCHFFLSCPDASAAAMDLDIRLIDAARVRALPRFFAQRWIVKDLAQFRYSLRQLKLPDAAWSAWFSQYIAARNAAVHDSIPDPAPLARRIERKARAIARHDVRLNRRQPRRNISIPPAMREE